MILSSSPAYRPPTAVSTVTGSTAKFGCRNQRKPLANGGPRQCGGDDKIDYRSAWETDAPEEAE